MLTATHPRITIIIGVLNMRDYLSKALDSVINQHYQNLEIIILDGKSTDGTLEVIKQYEKHITYWKSEPDRGHTEACNKAIDLATGDFIHFLNADDLMEEGLLHKVAETYCNHPEASIISCGVTITHQGKKIAEITSPEKIQINLFNMLFELPIVNGRFFNRSIFEKFGKFPAISAEGTYNIANDREFLINLALHNVHTEIIPLPLYHYFSHSESLTFSNRNAIRIHLEHTNIAEKQLNNPILNNPQKKLFKTWLIQEWLRLAWVYLKQKEYFASCQAIVKGMRINPFLWFGQAILMGCRLIGG